MVALATLPSSSLLQFDELHDPRPHVLCEAEWIFKNSIPNLRKERFARTIHWAIHTILDLVEEGYSDARRTFYFVRRSYEKAGLELPELIEVRAEGAKLMGPLHR